MMVIREGNDRESVALGVNSKFIQPTTCRCSQSFEVSCTTRMIVTNGSVCGDKSSRNHPTPDSVGRPSPGR